MRKLVIAIGLAIALGACSQSTDRSAPTVTTSAQQQVALQAAQAKVASCIPQGSLLSKEGRQKILDCVAPPAQQQALKQCVANAAAKANLATKAGRAKFRNEDLPNCVVQTQKGYK